MTAISVERAGFQGVGRTVTLAKADLSRQIDKALKGSYEPVLVSFGGMTAVIFRSPYGWNYRMKTNGDLVADGVKEITSCSTFNTRDEAIQEASEHVVNISPESTEFRNDADIPDWVEDKEARRRLLSSARFQRAYRHAKATQADAGNHVWHQWACDHSRDSMFD